MASNHTTPRLPATLGIKTFIQGLTIMEEGPQVDGKMASLKKDQVLQSIAINFPEQIDVLKLITYLNHSVAKYCLQYLGREKRQGSQENDEGSCNQDKKHCKNCKTALVSV